MLATKFASYNCSIHFCFFKLSHELAWAYYLDFLCQMFWIMWLKGLDITNVAPIVHISAMLSYKFRVVTQCLNFNHYNYLSSMNHEYTVNSNYLKYMHYIIAMNNG